MNTDINHYNENAEAEQQVEAHIEERATHPKMEELASNRSNSKSYYIVAYKAVFTDKVNQLWFLYASEAMGFIAKENITFDVKQFHIIKVVVTGDMYPKFKDTSIQELHDEAFMETNHAIAKITAP